MNQHVQIKEFLNSPGLYAHSDHVQDLLSDLPMSIATAISSCERLKPKLSELISSKYKLPTVESKISADDAAIIVSDLSSVERIIHISGAIWNANALRKIIDAKRVADALQGLDPSIYKIALSNIDLAPSVEETEDQNSAKPLSSVIVKDGLKCFKAWLLDLPLPVNTRIRLKFPKAFHEGDNPEGLYLSLGPKIVRRAVNRLSNDAS